MMKPDLYNKVKEYILCRQAGGKPYCNHFGLSDLERLGNRGHVQRCLSLLAKEGIMYERTHTEPCVAYYEHCETDKRFHIRISTEDARTMCDELGYNYEPYIPMSQAEANNRWAHPTLFKKPR